ncbi:MAG: hypothetical protein ACW981_15070 [Candidatus Hodarchaeales archaeon]|jgi:uncharacterized membrane protein
MISLHSPVVHFPIGGLFVTVIATSMAFLLNFLIARDKIPSSLKKFLGDDIITKLDFVAHVAGIIGLFGIILATFTGILDAGGANSLFITDLSIIIKGISSTLASNLLTYKIGMTIIVFNIFLVAGIFRLYFVTYKGKKHMYHNSIYIQLIYLISILYGFTFLVLIGAVGGILASGSTVLSQIPFVNELLPGGNPIFLGFYIIVPAFIALAIIIYALLDKRNNSKPIIN